jgi:hypothetical protein
LLRLRLALLLVLALEQVRLVEQRLALLAVRLPEQELLEALVALLGY